MAHFGRTLAAFSSAAFLAVGAGSAASATVIYQTGFEGPTYTLGGLAGQDGWNVFNNPLAVNVQNSIVASGAQAAMVTGFLAPGQTGPYRASPTAMTKISMSADIYLSASGSDRSWQFAALGPGLVGFAGGIDIDTAGNILAISGSFPIIGSFTRGVFHNVDIRLDYTAQTYDVLLDGSTLASGLAFCGSNSGCTGAVVPAYVNGLFDTFGANGDDVGVIDNFLVQTWESAVPEPATWAMMLTGFGVVGWSSRRRTRRTVSFG